MRSRIYWLLCLISVSGCFALSGCTWFTELRLHSSLKRANDAFDEKDFGLAATRYRSLSDRYPAGTDRRQQMVIREGLSYYSMRDYHSARDTFLSYMNEFPTGLYARDARTYLKKIDFVLAGQSAFDKAALEAVKSDLNQLERLRLQHPNEPSIVYAIGNLYYEMGDYTKAADNYFKATELDATYSEMHMIQERLVIDNDGKPKPVTPSEVEAKERERNPLVIFNSQHYISRDLSGQMGHEEPRFFQVTGLVRNQGSRILDGVVVDVRFLNAGHQILDVASYSIGTMGPNEVRAFVVTADTYDNLFNIVDFETTVRWNR